MAQYFTDFGSYTTGSGVPTGWTGRYVTSNFTVSVVEDGGATGGKHLRLARASSNGRSFISWDAIDADADRDEVEVLMRVRANAVGGADATHGTLVRASGSAGSEEAYWGMPLSRQAPSNDRIRINRYLSGTGVNLTLATLAWSVDTWYWVRFQVHGTAIKIRRWSGAIGDEPGTWDSETTDANITAAGWVGLFLFVHSVNFDVDVFGVGTNGDAAPSSAPSGGSTYDESISESLTLADVPANQAIFTSAVAESISLDDAATSGLVLLESVSESVGVDEATGSAAVFDAAVSESLGLDDAASSLLIAVAVITESVGVAETLSSQLIAGETITESLSLADTAAYESDAPSFTHNRRLYRRLLRRRGVRRQPPDYHNG